MSKIKKYDTVLVGIFDEALHGFSSYTLKKAKEDLEDAISKYGENALLDYEWDYDDNKQIVVTLEREETDEEYRLRLSRQKDTDYEMYQRLKKQFGE